MGKELGMRGAAAAIVVGTDSNAAKSFVARRGLGRMKHLEVRDMWLQKEVAEGKESENGGMGQLYKCTKTYEFVFNRINLY